VPAEERRYRSSYPENYEKLIIADYEWIAGVRSKMRERWISWLTQ
jgi:mannopine transport system substrate-binding protein